MCSTEAWKESGIISSLRHLIANKTVLPAALVVALLILAAIAAPWISSYSPTAVDAWHRLEGSSRAHLLGTDELGRDIYTRVVYAARVSLAVGFGGVGLSLVLGTLLGCWSGYRGGPLDTAIMRLMDVIFAFPAILLALIIVIAVGPGIQGTVIAIGIVYTAPLARLVRGATLSIKNRLFVEAARSSGVPDHRILFRHILPNMMGSILVLCTLRLGHAILVEASLSFLGLGVQPPTPAWGSMLYEGKNFMEQSPWMVIGPALATVLCILAFNLLGDSLRDVLDPTMRD